MVYNAPGQNLNNLDSWNYGFEAENGIKQSASGSMKQVGEEEFVVMRGSYQYIGADGKCFMFSKIDKTIWSEFLNISDAICMIKEVHVR